MPSSITHSAAEEAKAREAARPRRKTNPAQRPLPLEKASGDNGKRYSYEERVQALTLHTLGYSKEQIFDWIKVPGRQVNRIAKKARDRGFRPQEDFRILRHFIEDGQCPGRPKEITKETERQIL